MSSLVTSVLGTPASPAPRCTGLDGQFFARFEGSIVHSFGGGVDIWNSSGFIASDEKSSRLRLDSHAQARELSSGPSFTARSQSLFVANQTARVVTTSCAEEAVPFMFPPNACAGSIARFMPSKDVWAEGSDVWLGYDMLDGANVSVWGWTQSDPGRPANAMHRVYLEAQSDPAAGRLILEEQGANLGESYPTRASVRFFGFETILGSSFLFSFMGGVSVFTPPLVCNFEQPEWDPTTGKPPYDDTAYKCETTGFKVVKAVMHVTTDDQAFYTWPTLPQQPPKGVVTQVPHEGGPGPQVVCYAAKL